MYFPLGGGTLSGVSKPGAVVSAAPAGAAITSPISPAVTHARNIVDPSRWATPIVALND